MNKRDISNKIQIERAKINEALELLIEAKDSLLTLQNLLLKDFIDEEEN